MAEHRSEEILELLRSKNRCLEKLGGETRAFLSAPLESLVVESEGRPGPLSRYEEARSSLVHALELHDRTIGELVSVLSPEERTPELLRDVREEMLRNERLIVGIFNADDVVFRRIAEAQSEVLKLLHETRRARDLLGKFRSSPAPTGEGMDRTL